MALSVSAPIAGRTNGGAASFTISVGTIASGDVVVVLAGLGSQTITGVTDNLGNTYTQDEVSTDWAYVAAYRAVVTAPGSSTVTVTLSGVAHGAAHAYVVSGAANPPDDQSNADASDGAGSSAPVTIVPLSGAGQPNRVVFGVEATFLGTGTVTMTPGAGFTGAGTNSLPTSGQTISVNTEYKIVSSTAAQTVDGTLAFSVLWDMVGVTYLEASTAPTGTPSPPAASGLITDLPYPLQSRRLTTTDRNVNLDLVPGIGQFEAEFTFALVDTLTDQVIRYLTPYADSTPRLVHDTTRTIKRTLDMALGPEDTDVIDVIAHRIRVTCTVNGIAFPLGLYMFTDQIKIQFPTQEVSSITLVDLMFSVDQQISEPVQGTDPSGIGKTPSDFMLDLLEDLNTNPDVEPSPYLVQGAWNIGTSRGTIITDVCDLTDYFSPWFGNDEIFHMIRSFDPGDRIPDFDWDESNKVLAGSPQNSNDLIHAPNRFIVIGNLVSRDSVSTSLIGSYDIPSIAPHSIQNRGFVILEVVQLPVFTSQQANAAARNLGIQQTIFERAHVTTSIDPRHDSYNTVFWRGALWLELGWSMDLTPMGTMNHTLRKTYVDASD